MCIINLQLMFLHIVNAKSFYDFCSKKKYIKAILSSCTRGMNVQNIFNGFFMFVSKVASLVHEEFCILYLTHLINSTMKNLMNYKKFLNIFHS